VAGVEEMRNPYMILVGNIRRKYIKGCARIIGILRRMPARRIVTLRCELKWLGIMLSGEIWY
jgi:hypothetical protein